MYTTTATALKASDITGNGVIISRPLGNFIVKPCFTGYAILAGVSKQRLAKYPDIKAVKKFLTKF